MALSSSALSGLIRAAMIADPRIGAIDDSAKPTGEKALTALCDAIAGAVVAHIVASAVVNVTMSAGVTACGAGAGTCTGASTGTIT